MNRKILRGFLVAGGPVEGPCGLFGALFVSADSFHRHPGLRTILDESFTHVIAEAAANEQARAEYESLLRERAEWLKEQARQEEKFRPLLERVMKDLQRDAEQAMEAQADAMGKRPASAEIADQGDIDLAEEG